jgi:hypothetical protein
MMKLIELSRLKELLRSIRVKNGGAFQPATEQIHQREVAAKIEADQRKQVEGKVQTERTSILNLRLLSLASPQLDDGHAISSLGPLARTEGGNVRRVF